MHLPFTTEPACCDIVIVGAGPAGLMLAAHLARWGYSIRIVDKRLYPSAAGRADALQPHSIELLEHMGIESAIMAHSPARLFETCFWVSDGPGHRPRRTGVAPSCPASVDSRYYFQALLHQGLIEECLIDDLKRSNVEVQRPWTLTSFENSKRGSTYPLLARLAHIDGIASEAIQTKYIFSGEGSGSNIRRHLNIGFQYLEPPSYVWGVIDGRVRSDFPDIMMACSIRTESGSAMIIPRENDMIRFYVQISSATDSDWNPNKSATATEIQQIARAIISPYFIEWDYVEWSSSYQIRQGIADCWSIDQRIFLGGDACHAFSPKLGQGMNAAFMDAQNLAWKIHATEKGFAHRDILQTYETERVEVAKMLIKFDNSYANLYSSKPDISSKPVEESAKTKSDILEPYQDSRSFVSGHGFQYQPNSLNWSKDQVSASKYFDTGPETLSAGQLFIIADVIRVINADRVRLEQAVPPNGSFRIFVFAGNPLLSSRALHDLSSTLETYSWFATNSEKFLTDNPQCRKHNPHSNLFTLCVLFLEARLKIDLARDAPGIFSCYRFHVYADEQHFGGTDAVASAHAKAGFSGEKGGVVIVRPDGYIGAVLQLVEGSGTAEALQQYFISLRQPSSSQ